MQEQKEEVGKAVAKLHSEEELLASQQEKLRQAKDEYVDLAGVASAKPDDSGAGDVSADVRKAWACLGVPMALLDSQDAEVLTLLDNLQRSVQALQQKLPQPPAPASASGSAQTPAPAGGSAPTPGALDRGRQQEPQSDERSAEARSRSREKRLAEQKAKANVDAGSQESKAKQPRL